MKFLLLMSYNFTRKYSFLDLALLCSGRLSCNSRVFEVLISVPVSEANEGDWIIRSGKVIHRGHLNRGGVNFIAGYSEFLSLQPG